MVLNFPVSVSSPACVRLHLYTRTGRHRHSSSLPVLRSHPSNTLHEAGSLQSYSMYHPSPLQKVASHARLSRRQAAWWSVHLVGICDVLKWAVGWFVGRYGKAKQKRKGRKSKIPTTTKGALPWYTGHTFQPINSTISSNANPTPHSTDYRLDASAMAASSARSSASRRASCSLVMPSSTRWR